MTRIEQTTRQKLIDLATEMFPDYIGIRPATPEDRMSRVCRNLLRYIETQYPRDTDWDQYPEINNFLDGLSIVIKEELKKD